jgi:carotenoid 1,2-hydratase
VTIDLGSAPSALTSFDLSGDGKHTWTPIAPAARCTVALRSPGADDVTFSGSAYVDTNAGAEPLETAFSSWSWSRANSEQDGRTWICYETEGTRSEGSELHLLSEHGRVSRTAIAAPRVQLRNGLYGIRSIARLDEIHSVEVLEDTPFYARSLVKGVFDTHSVTMVHEQLDLKRFTKPWVQFLLPFRMRQDVSAKPNISSPRTGV